MTFCLLCHDEAGLERRLAGRCARCGGPACPEHDHCYGCHEPICVVCDSEPTPLFSLPGDSYAHPHNDADGALAAHVRLDD